MLIYISPPNPQNMKITVLVNDLMKKESKAARLNLAKVGLTEKNHF